MTCGKFPREEGEGVRKVICMAGGELELSL